MTETGLLYWPDRATRDRAVELYFRGLSDCRQFQVSSREEDDWLIEDGDSELSTLRPGYYIEVPIALRRAWIEAQRERNARGLRGPEHAAERDAIYRRHMSATGCIVGTI